MEQDLTQFAVLTQCDDPTGCDKMGDYFAIDADTMIDVICEVDLNEDWVRIFIFDRNVYYNTTCNLSH